MIYEHFWTLSLRIEIFFRQMLSCWPTWKLLQTEFLFHLTENSFELIYDIGMFWNIFLWISSVTRLVSRRWDCCDVTQKYFASKLFSCLRSVLCVSNFICKMTQITVWSSLIFNCFHAKTSQYKLALLTLTEDIIFHSNTRITRLSASNFDRHTSKV